MQLENMPFFEMFVPIIQTKTIESWTANDFWKQMKLVKKERNKFNRQRMYRVLRKLVENGYLTKTIDKSNQRFSKFSETKNIDFLRKSTNFIEENMAIENKISNINENIKILSNKRVALIKAMTDFPNLSHKAKLLKNELTTEIDNLEIYKDVLQTLRS